MTALRVERFGLAAFLLVVQPSLAAAQRITITPQLGAFVPLRTQSQWSWTDCCIGGGDFTETLRTDLSAAAAMGIKVGIGWDGWLGFEASIVTTDTERNIVWSASGIPNPPPADSFPTPARSTVASLRVTWRKPVSESVQLGIAVGPALVDQPQNAICGSEPPCIEKLSMFGATFDLALRFTLNRRFLFEITLGNSIYSMQYPEPPFPDGREVDPEKSSFLQHDMFIFAGLGFVL